MEREAELTLLDQRRLLQLYALQHRVHPNVARLQLLQVRGVGLLAPSPRRDGLPRCK
jgi:hypothetical protein